MKNEATNSMKASHSTDVVLQEIWRIKDRLSASYGHDVHRLFAETREQETQCGHPLVSLGDWLNNRRMAMRNEPPSGKPREIEPSLRELGDVPAHGKRANA